MNSEQIKQAQEILATNRNFLVNNKNRFLAIQNNICPLSQDQKQALINFYLESVAINDQLSNLIK